MSILADVEIKELCKATVSNSKFEVSNEDKQTSMITPFFDHQVREIKNEVTQTQKDLSSICLNHKPDEWSTTSGGIIYRKSKAISFGLSSYGYDVRLADEFKIFTNINSTVVDPLDFDQKCCVEHKGDYCIIPPNSYILGRTIEYFDIPRDVLVICLGKSTYARVGAIVNVTPIEAGFKGNVVIEISNSTTLPLKVYANMGISQFVFFRGKVPCEVSYADRAGKYQGQTSVQTALP